MPGPERRALILQLFAHARLTRAQAESVSYNTGWSDEGAEADASAAARALDAIGEEDLPILDEIAADTASPAAANARHEAARIRRAGSAARLEQRLHALLPEGERYARVFLESDREDPDALRAIERRWAERKETHQDTLAALIADRPRLEATRSVSIVGVVSTAVETMLASRPESVWEWVLGHDARRRALLSEVIELDHPCAAAAAAQVLADEHAWTASLRERIATLPIPVRIAIADEIAGLPHERRARVASLWSSDAASEVRLRAIAAANGQLPRDRLRELVASDPDEGVRNAAAYWLGMSALDASAAMRVEIADALRAHALRAPRSARLAAVAELSHVRMLIDGVAPPGVPLGEVLGAVGAAARAVAASPPDGEERIAALEALAVAAHRAHAADAKGDSVEVAAALIALLRQPDADAFAGLLGLSRRSKSVSVAVADAVAQSIGGRDGASSPYRDGVASDPTEDAFRLRLLSCVGIERAKAGYGIDRESIGKWLADPSDEVRVRAVELASWLATREDWAHIEQTSGPTISDRMREVLERRRPAR